MDACFSLDLRGSFTNIHNFDRESIIQSFFDWIIQIIWQRVVPLIIAVLDLSLSHKFQKV